MKHTSKQGNVIHSQAPEWPSIILKNTSPCMKRKSFLRETVVIHRQNDTGPTAKASIMKRKVQEIF